MSQQRHIVAFALLASLLTIAAVPANVMAADPALEVASEHTSDTDFQDATLTNTSVVGTGDSAVVALDHDNLELSNDTFNDGDHNGWTELQSSWSVTNGQLEASGTSGTWEIEKDSPTHSADDLNASLQFSFDNGFSGQDARFYPVYEDSNNYVRVRWISDNSDITLTVVEGGTTVAQVTGSWASDTANHTLRVVNESGTWELFVDGTSQGTDTATVSISGKSRIWYELDTITDPRALKVDNFDVESGSAPQTGEYNGGNHTASQIEEGRVELTLDNTTAGIEWQGWDGSQWVIVNNTTVSSSGIHTLNLSSGGFSKWRVVVNFSRSSEVFTAELEDEAVLFNAATPTVNNSTASPNATTVTTEQVTFSIDINDSDFATAQGDNVTVEFHTNTSGVIGTDTRSSNGTASITTGLDTGGDVKWWVVATDDYGESQRSANFTVTVPSELKVFNELDPDNLVNNTTLRIRFFKNDSDTVIERNVTDGTVDLTGLSVGNTFVVTVKSDNQNWSYRRIILTSIFEQSSVYLLPKDANKSEVVFALDDPTGQFPPTETRLFIEKPITKDYDGDGTNETRYQVIAGDTFGAAGNFPAVLENAARYRLRVETADQESSRVLGAYSVYASVTETLRIQRIEPSGETGEGETVYGGMTESGGSRFVAVRHRDFGNNTTEYVEYRILYPNGTVWVSNTTRSADSFADLYEVPSGIRDNATFKVEWTAVRTNQSNVSSFFYAGQVPGIAGRFSMDAQVLSIASWFVILSTMGLLVIVDARLAPMGGVGVASALTIMGTVAIPMPMLGVAGAVSVLTLFGGR